MKRKLTKFLLVVLSTIGVGMTVTKRTKRLVLRIMSLSCPICGFFFVLMFMLKRYNSFQDLALSMTYLFGYFNTLISCFICIYKSDQIRHLLDHIDEEIFIYIDEEQIEPNYKGILCERNMIRLFICMLCGSVILLTAACLGAFIRLILTDEECVFLIPACFPGGSRILNYVLQLVIAYPTMWMFSVKWIAPLIVSLEFERQSERLCAALRTIEKRSKMEVQEISLAATSASQADQRENNTFANFASYRNMIRKNIIQCIQHHQKLTKAFALYGSWFELVFSAQLSCSSISTTFSLWCLYKEMAFHYKIGTCCALFAWLFELFIWCYIGNSFSILDEQIKQTIFYKVEWYKFPMAERKLLILFHLLVHAKPYKLYGFLIVEPIYNTFTRICRNSYSYFNVLRRIF